MTMDEKSNQPAMASNNVGSAAPPAYPPYEPYQQLPMQPGYGAAGNAMGGLATAPAEIHQGRNNNNPFNNCLGNQEEEEGKKDDELLPGSGPGGVPQKYFNLDFENFFKEDKDTKTFRELYKVLGILYKYIKLITYHFFVILIGFIMVVVYAIVNGIMIFILVWIWAPILRLTIVSIYAVAPTVTVPIQAILGPYFDVVARMFRQIRVRGDLSGSLGWNGARSAEQEHIA